MEYDVGRAKRYCVWLLSRGEVSEFQLRGKLKNKKCEQSVIDETLAWVKLMGFQSDERCAKAKARVEAKKKGNRLVKQKLESIGLDRELVVSALEEQPSEVERLREICQKFEGKLIDDKGYAKAMRYLASRGFPYSECKKELDILRKKE